MVNCYILDCNMNVWGIDVPLVVSYVDLMIIMIVSKIFYSYQNSCILFYLLAKDFTHIRINIFYLLGESINIISNY